jgi:hypothetical protein
MIGALILGVIFGMFIGIYIGYKIKEHGINYAMNKDLINMERRFNHE